MVLPIAPFECSHSGQPQRTWPTSEWKRVMLMDGIKLIYILVVLWLVALHILCGSLTIGGRWKQSSSNCEHWPCIKQVSLLFRQLFLDWRLVTRSTAALGHKVTLFEENIKGGRKFPHVTILNTPLLSDLKCWSGSQWVTNAKARYRAAGAAQSINQSFIS